MKMEMKVDDSKQKHEYDSDDVQVYTASGLKEDIDQLFDYLNNYCKDPANHFGLIGID